MRSTKMPARQIRTGRAMGTGPNQLCKHVHRLEAAADHVFARNTEPLLKDRRVHLAEVDAEFEIAVHEFGQARVIADGARLDLATDQEHRSAGPVVRALATVLL